MDIIEALSKEFNVPKERIEKTVALIDEGNTIPFIARYRKEVTGSLDDTVLRELDERLNYLRSIEKRKSEVIALISAQEKLTPELENSIMAAKTITEVDDIYRPFRPKRKTRASIAKERGLEALAMLLLEQRLTYAPTIDVEAKKYVNEEMGVSSATAALTGACDIIAEDVSDNAEYRKVLRAITLENGYLVSKQSKDEDSVYSQYYDYTEPLGTIPGHRILAINRGEAEGFLKISVQIDKEKAIEYLLKHTVVCADSPAAVYIHSAVIDAYDRLIAPAIEREIRSYAFDNACEGAIKLFSMNLSNLLMQAPLKGKVVMGYDPGYRTGCKLAVVDKTGKVLDTAVIFPTKPQERIAESKATVLKLIRKYGVDIIAIGNGTASKESEIFIANLIREIPEDVKYAMVSEAGASVYSASSLAAEEFPNFDVTQRSAVSIARRLQDPLAELVKIDPKSIGVGQYQHDMKSARLDEALGGVVEDCVNKVGVDLNTASYSLLSYIAGINVAIAKNIVAYREENGEFTSRQQLKKVPRIGDKAFEQCAGFLRIPDADEILDNTGVHPESYEAAKKLLEMFGYTEDDVRDSRLDALDMKIMLKGTVKVCNALGIGEPTLNDIVKELQKPGRDIRDALSLPVLRDDVLDINDLKEGMVLTGTVRNVIDFGAFVDIGVHQDGLIHISQISDRYVKHPSDVLAVGDVVKVRILSVDAKKKRISLTMKSEPKSN